MGPTRYVKVRFPTKLVNSERCDNINKQRFKNMSSDAIDDIITKAETKKTKESPKWALRVFEGEFFIVKI